MFRYLIFIVLLMLPATGRAEPVSPELRFGRLVSVYPASAPTLLVGISSSAGDLDRRLAVAGQIGLGYAGAIRDSFSWQVALFGLKAGRGQETSGNFGHGRTALIWSDQHWTMAAGIDLWIDDELASWLDAPSPWGALSWQHRLFHLGASFTWDRSDQLELRSRVSAWSTSSRPGLIPTLSVGLKPGPIVLTVSYSQQLDDLELLEDTAALDLSWSNAVAVGNWIPFASVRLPVVEGRNRSWLTTEIGVRFEFDIKAVGDELWNRSDNNKEPVQPAFDPFG